MRKEPQHKMGIQSLTNNDGLQIFNAKPLTEAERKRLFPDGPTSLRQLKAKKLNKPHKK